MDQQLESVNDVLKPKNATQRISWAVDSFGDKLFCLSSAGIDSALILDLIAKSGHSIPIIHINTGFLDDKTLVFRDMLIRQYGLKLYEFGPTTKQIDEIKKQRLWDHDLAEYLRITKLDPLSEAIKELGASALISGVRADQTANRGTLKIIGEGNDGELRVHPVLDWSRYKVNAYIKSEGLLRHPLYAVGFNSLGDKQMTIPAASRTGRAVMECGIHVKK